MFVVIAVPNRGSVEIVPRFWATIKLYLELHGVESWEMHEIKGFMKRPSHMNHVIGRKPHVSKFIGFG